MSFKIQLVKTDDDYQKILAVRRKVFIEEQNVSEDIEIGQASFSINLICDYTDNYLITLSNIVLAINL